MSIAVFTQDGCVQCEALKDVLAGRGLEYKEYDAGDALSPTKEGYFERHPDWKSSGVVPALGLLQIDNTLPIVVIDNEAHNYEEALLKVSKSNNIIKLAPCTDGSCELPRQAMA